ncbi:hypothetical protein BIZ83_gp191 [Erwinia phage vB_EamM_ChrisDB]|uniref:hypothetical protein n=1 Tax=Erwinia phage vB_EamM_ChrisDB TaxID=1883371 RepID=UPI00081C8D19|nr:hypothetical protein BIZ83_gp191 [Erwinia phage vB_EamM_ChrisDB]ANZ48662.1 hypothetical protein CHRISDB_100 [Erwinia phage vB_EamM_ChrisDB]
MSQTIQEATSTVLDVLIQAGTNKLSADEAAKVKEAAVVAVGSAAQIDVTQPASVILSSLRPLIVEQVGNFGKTMENLAVGAIEGLDAKYGKETIMTLWPSLSFPVKAIIWILVLFTIGTDVYMMTDILRREAVDLFDAATIGLLPLIGLLLFCTVPIKTLAYTSLSVGAKVVEARLQKSTASNPSKSNTQK